VACARHGCFALNRIVNLFKGEQQKNVNWAFLKSLKHTNVDPDQGGTLLYDITCQYWIYVLERIGHLLPTGLLLDAGIGSFHVHGHKDQCFHRFGVGFMPGIGVVSGEILESVWSTYNTISPAVQTATLAHHAEVLDDHACDNNHKKAIGLSKCSVCNSGLLI